MEARVIQKPSSRLVEYLNAYLSDVEFEKIEQNTKNAKAELPKLLESYKKQFEIYSVEKKDYKQRCDEYKKKSEVYTQALEAYKKNSVPPEPTAPLAPTAPSAPIYPVLKTDPRLKSREELQNALKNNVPGFLSRLLNQFPFAYVVQEKEKAKEFTAIDNEVVERITPIYLDIQTKGSFEFVFEDDKRILKVDDDSRTRVKQLAADITFYGCQELMDEKGQLHPIIIQRLKLNDVEKKWSDEKDRELTSQILPQVLFGYCSQMLIGAIRKRCEKALEKESKNEAGLCELYLQEQLYEIDEKKQGRPTEFFLDQISAYRFYRSVVSELEKLPHHQITSIVNADVSCVETHTVQQEKIIEESRMVFWNNVIHYMTLRPEWSSGLQSIAQAIQRGFVDQVHHYERFESYLSVPFELGMQMRARDNIWLLDHFIQYAKDQKQELSAKQIEYVSNLKLQNNKLNQSIGDLFIELERKFDDTFQALTFNYLDSINSVTHLSTYSPRADHKKEALFLNVHRLHQHKLPVQDSKRKAESQFSLESFKKKDPDGQAYEQLVKEIKDWKRKNYSPMLDWYVNYRHRHKIYVVHQAENPADELLEKIVDQSPVIEGKATYTIKDQLMSNLLQTLIRESQKTPPPPLKKVIDDWKEEKIGPYYLDSKAEGKAYTTHYDVLCIQSGWSIGISDTQAIVDNALKKLELPVLVKNQS